MLRRNLCAAGAIAGLATFARGAECLAPAAPALAGKTAVIFGGTSGIGLAAAIALRAEGADVVAVSRNPSRASAEAERHNISLVACDVRDRSALDATLRALPKLDIIVAAATGGKRAVGPFLEMDMEGYQGSFDKCPCWSPNPGLLHARRPFSHQSTVRALAWTGCGDTPISCGMGRPFSLPMGALSW